MPFHSIANPPSAMRHSGSQRLFLQALSTAIESWRNRDREQALSVRPRQAPIRAECESLYSTLARLVSTPGEGNAYVDLMLICKYLERILWHGVSVADEAVDAAPLSHVRIRRHWLY